MFSHSPDDDDNSALDVVLTESFSSSTGEAPSAVTFRCVGVVAVYLSLLLSVSLQVCLFSWMRMFMSFVVS